MVIILSFSSLQNIAGALQCQTCTDAQCTNTILRNCTSGFRCITASIEGNHSLCLPLYPSVKYKLHIYVFFVMTLTACTLILQPMFLGVWYGRFPEDVQPKQSVHQTASTALQPTWVFHRHLHHFFVAAQVTATWEMSIVSRRG